MKRTKVESSSLKSIGYDSDEEVLEVEFRAGSVYRYKKVPKSIYDDLIAEQKRVANGDNTASVGQVFVYKVRDKAFEYEKV